MESARFGRRFLLGFSPALLVAVAFLVYPVYVIRPFRRQGPGELLVALTAIRYRPLVEAVCVLAAAGAFVWYWRRERRKFRRAVSAVGVLAVLAVALLSRINIYELMFHPIDRPAFAAIRDTRLDSDERVIAVKLGGAARAYPIRGMSYHHVVNDTLGGVPIVATY